MKLLFDGKQIGRGKYLQMEDIDCWGHEKRPTLKERQHQHASNLKLVRDAITLIDRFEEKGITDVQHLGIQNKQLILASLKDVVVLPF